MAFDDKCIPIYSQYLKIDYSAFSGYTIYMSYKRRIEVEDTTFLTFAFKQKHYNAISYFSYDKDDDLCIVFVKPDLNKHSSIKLDELGEFELGEIIEDFEEVECYPRYCILPSK